MKFCKICVQPNTRPNSYFNSKGICPACDYNFKIKKIDWNKRLNLLKIIADKYKKKIIHLLIIMIV